MKTGIQVLDPGLQALELVRLTVTNKCNEMSKIVEYLNDKKVSGTPTDNNLAQEVFHYELTPAEWKQFKTDFPHFFDK